MTQPRKQFRKTRPGKKLEDEFDSQFALLAGSSYLKSLVNLEENMPQRIPDEVPATSAIFKSPTVVLLPSAGTWNADLRGSVPDANIGESTVALFPGVSKSIWHTSGQEQIALQVGSFDAFVPAMVSSQPFSNEGNPVFIDHALLSPSSGVVPRVDNEGIPWYEMTIDTTDAEDPDVILVLSNRKRVPNAGVANFRLRWVVGGVVTIGIGLPFRDSERVPFTFPKGTTAIAVEILDTHINDGWLFSIAVTGAPFVNTPSLIRLESYSCQNMTVLDVPDLSTLDRTHSERTTALTGLITYMGSDLANGGVISFARLPRGLTPIRADRGNFYNYLARQPFYCGDYPLKDGAYAWWCPDDEQEIFFEPYLDIRSQILDTTSSLWFSMRRDDSDQDIRLDTNHALEVLTRSVQYSAEVGPVNPLFPEILAAVKTLPAGSENNRHIQLFGGLLRKLRDQILKPANLKRIVSTGASFLQSL